MGRLSDAEIARSPLMRALPARAQRGMTLIEVLVAFSIVALSLGIIFQIFSSGLRGVRVSESYGRAVLLAESKLATVGIEVPLQTGDSRGGVESDMRWTLSVRPWPAAEGGVTPGLLEVRVAVEWLDGLRPERIELTTLRLLPQPTPGGKS